MTNQQIIDKYLKEFHEVRGLKVPIELNSYLHRIIEEAVRLNNKHSECNCLNRRSIWEKYECVDCGKLHMGVDN